MEKRTFVIGDGINTEFVLEHDLGTPDVVVSVRENKLPGDISLVGLTIVNENTVKILINPVPDNDQYAVTIIG